MDAELKRMRDAIEDLVGSDLLVEHGYEGSLKLYGEERDRLAKALAAVDEDEAISVEEFDGAGVAIKRTVRIGDLSKTDVVLLPFEAKGIDAEDVVQFLRDNAHNIFPPNNAIPVKPIEEQ